MASMIAPSRILLVDDDPDLLYLLKDALEHNGFQVATAYDGAEALALIAKAAPDLVVLDMAMPRMNGIEAVRRMRDQPALRHLPVILLSATATRDDKIEGLGLGADDFVMKPVDMSEFVARVKMVLRRTREGLDANPLSRLPGNAAIESSIREAVAAQRPLAVLYADLNHFKAYNDAYGYEAGDRVIRETAALLSALAEDSTRGVEFLGHVGGDDFILQTTPDRMEDLAAEIIKRFDAKAPGFYREEDRRRGGITSTDRQGRRCEFPFLSIAIGICHNTLRPLTSYAQVAQLGAELKKEAKNSPCSAYAVDRRRS